MIHLNYHGVLELRIRDAVSEPTGAETNRVGGARSTVEISFSFGSAGLQGVSFIK